MELRHSLYKINYKEYTNCSSRTEHSKNGMRDAYVITGSANNVGLWKHRNLLAATISRYRMYTFLQQGVSQFRMARRVVLLSFLPSLSVRPSLCFDACSLVAG